MSRHTKRGTFFGASNAQWLQICVFFVVVVVFCCCCFFFCCFFFFSFLPDASSRFLLYVCEQQRFAPVTLLVTYVLRALFSCAGSYELIVCNLSDRIIK